MAYVTYAACAVPVTNFSAGGELQLVSNFTELHILMRSCLSGKLSVKPLQSSGGLVQNSR